MYVLSFHVQDSYLTTTTQHAGCSTDGFYRYVAPKMGDTVDSLKPLPITWNPSCLDSTEIDI